MAYPEGLIIWGTPIILLAFCVECAVRKAIRSKSEADSFQKERMVKFLTRTLTLAILTVIYFLTRD